MKQVKREKQRFKLKGDKQMNTNSERLDPKKINLIQSNSVNDEENDQMKKQSKMTRRPKSGKSL